MSKPEREVRTPTVDTLERDLRIDSLCSRFEAALKAGERPVVADFLADAPDELRGSLEFELRLVLNAFQASSAERTEPSSFADIVVTADSHIGPYTLVEKIGEGGMGEVWKVSQETPVKRVAALKFIKAGMDSRQVLARFEQERQALALLDHPNIARVLDGGLTPHLRPYFVMELVQGQPLTKFCDEARLGIPERLELFLKICQAVQYAHQKGIVHRDLKPSNILVALSDLGAPGLVKIIDFGVAKVLGDGLTNETLSTRPGMVVGTLEYMAPEQAGAATADVDTRADIYSLGVILYELLTGLRPFDGERLRKVPFDELIRIIREEEPPRPSTGFSAAASRPALTAARRTEPKSLTALLRGDLDWIVMKCLEKDRARRYESASSLARDIERYLASEPVEARPPSVSYKLQKFVRRNQGSVLAGSLLLALLIAAVVGTTWGLFQARSAEARAIAERNEKELARREEERQRTEATQQRIKADREKVKVDQARIEAQRRLAQIERGNEIILSIFDDLDIDTLKLTSESLDALLARRLVDAGALLDGDSLGDPLDVARLQNRLGGTLLALGHAGDALPLFEKSQATHRKILGDEHPATLSSTNNVAAAFLALGKLNLALPLFEETLRLRQANQGPDHPETLTSMNNVAVIYQDLGQLKRALPLYETTYTRRKAVLGPEDPDTLLSLRGLANVCLEAGQFDLAVEYHAEALQRLRAVFGPRHIQSLSSMRDLARAHLAFEKVDLATPLLEEAFSLMKVRPGPDHPETIDTLNALGRAYWLAGKYDLARKLQEETLKTATDRLGRDHLQTLTSMNNLGVTCWSLDQPELATPLLEEALTAKRAKLGGDHPETLRSMHNLACVYLSVGKSDVALSMLERTLELRREKLGSNHPETLVTMLKLADALGNAGKPDRALPLYEELLKLRKDRLGPVHSQTFAARDSLLRGYQAAGKYNLAVSLLEDTLTLRKAELGLDHAETSATMFHLAELYTRTNRLALALPLYEETARLCQANFGPDDVRTLASKSGLARGYQAAGKLDLALPIYEQTANAIRAKLGAEHVQTLVAMHTLATAYHSAGRLDRALPLLEETLKSFTATQGPEHVNSVGCRNSLIAACVSSNRVEQEEALRLEWVKTLRDKYPPTDSRFFTALYNLGECRLRAKKYVEAEETLRECVAAAGNLSPVAWTAFDAQLLLGLALMGREDFAAAEAHLLKGYEGLKAHEKTLTPDARSRLPETADRLIVLYAALENPAEVEKWRAERALYPAKTSVQPASGR